MSVFDAIALPALAFWKRLLSFPRRGWTIEDYPVYCRKQAECSPHNTRGKALPWIARVVNWPTLVASGQTKQQALEAVAKNFQKYKEVNPPLPRPGAKFRVPVTFARQDRIAKHQELADDFVSRIVGVNWAFISDESSLSDFHAEEDDDALHQKILASYGVDVSDIRDGNISDILERIAQHGNRDLK